MGGYSLAPQRPSEVQQSPGLRHTPVLTCPKPQYFFLRATRLGGGVAGGMVGAVVGGVVGATGLAVAGGSGAGVPPVSWTLREQGKKRGL